MTHGMKNGAMGMAGVAAGLVIAVAGLSSGSSVQAASQSSVAAAGAPVAASPSYTGMRTPSLAQQVEGADELALSATGGGRVTAIRRAITSTWVVTVKKSGQSQNVWVNLPNNQVLKTAYGTASPLAIH